jgi:hypothetical protein
MSAKSTALTDDKLKRKRALERKWYAENKERKKAQNARWRASNPDQVKATNAVWRAKNRVTLLERSRAWEKKMRESSAPEIVAEQYLRERVEALGGMCPKFVDPSRRGAPDRMVLLPGHPVYFVEMKRYKVGKVRSWQERYHADLRACGHKVWVLWSKEEVDEFFTSI